MLSQCRGESIPRAELARTRNFPPLIMNDFSVFLEICHGISSFSAMNWIFSSYCLLSQSQKYEKHIKISETEGLFDSSY